MIFSLNSDNPDKNMSEVLKDKILDYALNAYIESRAKKRADTFIYESELRRHFKSNGDEIPDLLNLLSHPLSQTKYLTKHTNGKYEINQEGIRLSVAGYTREEDEHRNYTKQLYSRREKEVISIKIEESVNKAGSFSIEHPFWQSVIILAAVLFGILSVAVPIYLYLNSD